MKLEVQGKRREEHSPSKQNYSSRPSILMATILKDMLGNFSLGRHG
jgi:hypothetical protein